MTCRVQACPELACPDALVCGRHLNDLWCNRLERQDDGTFIVRGSLPRWRRRVEDPVGEGVAAGIERDWTGAARTAA